MIKYQSKCQIEYCRQRGSTYQCICQINLTKYDQTSFKMSKIILQAKKEHLSTYFRPVPPSLALKQDGEAAWALVSS